MISVIILSSSGNYAVLDVPENGRLVIRERHLICGMTRYGVRVIPYGTVLSPFEVFIQDNTLSVEMVPRHLFQQEGRVLDFSAIELLQAQTTINPAENGSSQQLEPVTYYDENGLAINYNVKLKGSDFASLEAARDWLMNYNTPPNHPMSNPNLMTVNGLKNEGAYQLLSVHYADQLAGRKFKGTNITEFYDLGGVFNDLGHYAWESSTLQYVEMPKLEAWGTLFAFQGASALQEVKVPKLKTIGTTAGQDATEFTGFKYAPANLKLTVSAFMQTSNAGALEGDLQQALNLGKGIQITFV